jgi:hypothetical protein
MNDLQMADIAGIDWEALLASAQTSGVEFGIKAVIAILIFYVGRTIARLITRGLHNVMQKQEVDKILETFVCNLAYWTMMTLASAGRRRISKRSTTAFPRPTAGGWSR